MLHCYTIFYYTILCYAVLDGTILPHGKATLGKASKLRPDKPVGILLDTKANVTLVLDTGHSMLSYMILYCITMHHFAFYNIILPGVVLTAVERPRLGIRSRARDPRSARASSRTEKLPLALVGRGRDR